MRLFSYSPCSPRRPLAWGFALGIWKAADIIGAKIIWIQRNAGARISAAYAEQAFEYWGALTGEAENAEYLRDYLEARLKRATNYCFYLTDENGQVVLQNFEGAPSGQGWDYGSIDGADGRAYEQRGFVREISANDDYYESYQAYLRLAPYKYTMIVWLGVLVLASVALLVFLFCSAGRRPESTGVVKNFQDRIPVDLFALAVALVGVSLAALTRRMLYMENASLVQRIFLFVPVCLGWVLLALDGAMSFATRFKAGKWWRSAILYRAAHWLYIRAAGIFWPCEDYLESSAAVPGLCRGDSSSYAAI